MAFRAGARLANVEYLRMTVVPKGFSAPGLNALVGMGGKLINGMGEEFMHRYDPMGMKGARHKLAQAILTEMKAHRGPIRVDCRHLAPDALKHLIATLSYDKDTLPEYFQQKGIDLSKDLLEVATSEGMQGGPNEVCGSGIKIDDNCATHVPGLFAAGNSADQCRSLHMAVTSGIHAGRSLSAYATGMGKSGPSLPENQVKEIRERVYAPMKESRKVSWQEFEDVLQRTLTEGMGPSRSEWGMKKAWQSLDLLDRWRDQVGAKTYHDLCRTQEVCNMITVARCMITAALHRKESRFGQCHYRLDYPEPDDRNWLGQVVVVKDGEGRAQPLFWPLRYE
jgi:adenylylsulfate reductase subunit A